MRNMARIEAWNFMKKLPDGNVTIVIRHQLPTTTTPVPESESNKDTAEDNPAADTAADTTIVAEDVPESAENS